jgi:hypothetical protein
MKGYDDFFETLGTIDKRFCQVCGTECTVKRDQLGYISWAGEMGKIKVAHDYFYCPNFKQSWHEQALELVLAIEKMPSKRVAELMQLDLVELLGVHGCRLEGRN